MAIISLNLFGTPIGQQKETGYFNATKISHYYKAISGNSRDVSDWLANKRTKESIAHLSGVTGIPVTELAIVSRGGNPEEQGTWLHPKLSLRFGMWLSDEIGYWVEEEFANWAKSSQKPAEAPHWYRRLGLFRAKTKIPVGYWCIFEEIVSLEQYGYIPPLGVVPDISVGKCWANHMRKELEIEPRDVGMKYKHYYPDWEEPVEAYIYPLEYLATFRMWIEETYKPKKMLIYFRKADASALPSACKLLGLPEGK